MLAVEEYEYPDDNKYGERYDPVSVQRVLMIFCAPRPGTRDGEFEALLYVAHSAYEMKTGEEYPHSSSPDFETFSNKTGWPSRGSA